MPDQRYYIIFISCGKDEQNLNGDELLAIVRVGDGVVANLNAKNVGTYKTRERLLSKTSICQLIHNLLAPIMALSDGPFACGKVIRKDESSKRITGLKILY
jgi:hypothetical protein